MDDLDKQIEARVKAFESGDVGWYEEEFLCPNLGDSRLDKRLGIIMNYRIQHPNASMPVRYDSWAKTKAAFSFFSNDKVDTELIMESHKNSTIYQTPNRITLKRLV